MKSKGDGGELPKGSWTIHDIARVLGVSAKTVSRVVNNEPGVGLETRARVTDMINQVAYQPHTGARSMRSRPRDCLGVTVGAPMDEAPMNQDQLTWLFIELYRTFGLKQFFISWDLHPPMREGALDYGRGLWQRRYGGCIIIGPLATDDRTIHQIHQSECPYLALGRLDSLPEISHATVDYEDGAYVSAKFLFGRGHKRVSMLKAFEGYQPSVERRRGYFRAVEEANAESCESLIRSVSFGARDITNAVYRLLLDPSVTALIDCSGCEDADSLREGARRAGRVLGKDVEVVCWTYTHEAVVLSEACAHMWIPAREAATEGFELLYRWFRGDAEGPVHVLYRPTLYLTPEGRERARPKRLFDLLS